MVQLARYPLSLTDQEKIRKLVATLSDADLPFYCGGNIKLDREVGLLYRTDNQDGAKYIQFPESDPSKLEMLLKTCIPSPHGRGNETVYDESYRLARELPPDTFAFTADFFEQSGILASIAALTSARNPDGRVEARLYKVNAYTTGGFFKSHRDTPKSDNHIGTVVVGLPSAFQGGALRVSHDGKDILFDWGDVLSKSSEIILPWAFLFSDVEHEIYPVTSGVRLTVVYDIFATTGSPNAQPSVNMSVDAKTLPLYNDIVGIFSDKTFLPMGGQLAITLSHSYPMNTETGDIENTGSNFSFKGVDAALYRVIKSLGFKSTLKAVFDVAQVWKGHYYARQMESLLGRRSASEVPEDGFGPIQPYYEGADFVILTSDKLEYKDFDYQMEDGDGETAKELFGAKFEPELIWARLPTQASKSKTGNYVRYGNDATLGTMYASVALVIHVPPVGEAPRNVAA